MAIIKRNDCNGCPDCRRCGMDKGYLLIVCDHCGEDANLYEIDTEVLCLNCLKNCDAVRVLYSDFIAERQEDFLEWAGFKRVMT